MSVGVLLKYTSKRPYSAAIPIYRRRLFLGEVDSTQESSSTPVNRTNWILMTTADLPSFEIVSGELSQSISEHRHLNVSMQAKHREHERICTSAIANIQRGNECLITVPQQLIDS